MLVTYRSEGRREMSGRERCDEVLRLIDDALEEYERDVDARPTRSVALTRVEARASA